jgi:Ni,Fe-hydrogenase I cytochrome b subunit
MEKENFISKSSLLKFIFIITLTSMPGYVKCDPIETISSFILFILVVLFICAGIGYCSRREENENK